MPHAWNNLIVVTKEELVPAWYNSMNSLSKSIYRYQNFPYGIKRVQLGGNGRQMLIDFDSLPMNIQEGLGDPRKLNHILERFYRIDPDAVSFYASFKFYDGTYLDADYQEKYIINASVLKAVISLRSARENERRTKGGSTAGIIGTLCSDAASFQKTLKTKFGVEHSLPESLKRFKIALKSFETAGYPSLISAKHKNNNSRKVTDYTLALLKNMFAGVDTKPTATQVYRNYDSFLSGYMEVINNQSGEVYNPSDFKKLSPQTVTNYMAEWTNKIGTHALRSGDRQTYMQKFKPYHSLDKPKFAGSIISIDDRQPPFKSTNGKRVWFYNGIDLASEALTCWVSGAEKEGIILEFYRQLVRNYAEWGFNLPNELEAEMSLNSSFVDTFLKPGAMFQEVRIEANNARGKRIEAYYRQLRYAVEKDRDGWIARPFAISESNQAGPIKAKELPYDEIIQGCHQDIEKWNNMPHSVHKDMTRWDVFTQMQHPDLKPTNYKSILPHLGYKTRTSANVGIIKLQGREYLLGENDMICTGENLINLMKIVEGKQVDVYWLDDNDGLVFKALVFIGNQYICDAIAKPTYNRARIEQTPQDQINRELMSSYVATIEAYGRRQKQTIDPVTIINNTPAPKKSFVMRGLNHTETTAEWTKPEVLHDLPLSEEFNLPANGFTKNLRDRF
jgi:hypothetical protein